MPTVTFDVVVLGAGMAGMCAAATASEHGARVAVLDPAPTIGGSAVLSHGSVWTAADLDALHAEDDGVYQRHGHQVVTQFLQATDWLATFGAALGPRRVARGRQGQRFDLAMTFLRMAQMVSASGGRIMTDTRVEQVDAGADGRFHLRAAHGPFEARSLDE